MKNIFTVLCTKSLIDELSNNLSAIEIIDQVNVSISKKTKEQASKEGKEFVQLRNNLELVMLWYDDELSRAREFEFKVNIVNSKNETIGTLADSFVLPKGKKRIRNRLFLNGLPVSVTDIYLMKVYYRERGKDKFIKANELPVDITVNVR